MKEYSYISLECEEIESNGVKCPYCGSIEQEPYMPDEESIETECLDCGKKFVAERCIMVDYRSYVNCELIGEKHEWSDSLTHKGWKDCDKCGAFACFIKTKNKKG